MNKDKNNPSLETMIHQIETIFPEFNKTGELNINDTKRYYDKSSLGYKFFHSYEGAIHMALSETEEFSEKDYEGQALSVAKEIEKRLKEKNTLEVLELGCGKGFNSSLLARMFPSVNFIGIDISPEHLRLAIKSARDLDNFHVQEGNFDQLEFKDNSFDLIFEVEAVCHSNDHPKLLKSLYKILKPKGEIVLFEGFREKWDGIEESEQKMISYIEKSMAVNKGIEFKTWASMAEKAGFILEHKEISKKIIPNLKRFHRLAGKYFRRPNAAKLINVIISKELVLNSIAGYLMKYSVENNFHGYYHVKLTKP